MRTFHAPRTPSARIRHRVREGRWGAALLVALVLLSASGARAFGATPRPPAERVCSLTQITHTGPPARNFPPEINAAGTRIVFRSTADLTGENPDGIAEIFLFNTTTNTLTQVTTGNEFVGPPTSRVAINAAGTRIAFATSADLTGENPDRNTEIFLVDTRTGSLTQLTHSTGTRSTALPSIDALGTRIAFVSSGDLTGDNPDGNLEIFLVDTRTGSLTQLTHSTSGSSGGSGPSIDALGTRIAFNSTADLTGDNPDGNSEIFLVNTATGSLTQLTSSITPLFGGSIAPAINALGTRIAFSSEADLTGENPDGNSEIFLVNTATGSLIQLTHSTSGSSSSPAINALGTRIAFNSTADLTGDNPDGNLEIFLVDTRTGSLTQLTHSTSGSSSSPAIDALGTRIAFDSTADLTGDNPDGNIEIFLATCVERGKEGEE